MFKGIKIFLIIYLYIGASYLHAEVLSKRALLHRCYQHLTLSPLPPGDPLLLRVDRGEDPIDICINVVLKAGFFTNQSATRFELDPNNIALGTNVVKTFHLLHSSWFFRRDFPIGALLLNINNNMHGIYENNAAALYYTRALLDPKVDANYFLTTKDYLRSIRSQGFPVKNIYMTEADSLKFSNFMGVNLLYQFGNPLGVRVLLEEEKTFPTTTQDNYPRGFTNFPRDTITILENFGGGFLGLDIYLAQTVEELPSVISDGVVEVPRKWSESVFLDAMCRELPVVRPSDAATFVVPSSRAEFRRSQGCVGCHASTDQMAGLIKSYAYGERRSQEVWTPYINKSLWNKGAAADYTWSSEPRTNFRASGRDFSNYLREDHVGKLYYRGYDGRVVDRRVDSISALGSELSKQIEPYLCATKRYYKYFTGIDVVIDDPGVSPLPMNPKHQTHYDFVVETTKRIFSPDGKTVTSPAKMSAVIEAILRSPQYKLLNFGVYDEP